MTAGRLMRYRIRALTRRISGPRTGSGALVAAVALSALVAALWFFARWAQSDVMSGGEHLETTLGGRAFWFAALPTLIFAYTTFEVIFRAPDRGFVGLLPLDGRSRWLDLQLRAYAVHLPLLIPALGYSAALFWYDQTLGATRVLSVTLVAYTLGIALCSWIHLMAGRTMLRVSTPLSRALAGGVIDDDAALILYAPAGGLTLTLVLIVFLDLFTARALAAAQPFELLTVLWVVLSLTTIWIIRRAAHEAQGCLTLVSSRFEEVDTPLPYREDGVPEHCPGEGKAEHLNLQTRALFLRDLKQLRRRHRVDKVLLWIFAALALRTGLSQDPTSTQLLEDLSVLYATFVGLFWTNAFRLRGDELGSPWLDNTLPTRGASSLNAALIIDLSYPAWALLWCIAAALIAKAWLTAGMVAIAGVGLALTSTLLSRALSAIMAGHQTAASIAWRASVIVIIALFPGGSP